MVDTVKNPPQKKSPWRIMGFVLLSTIVLYLYMALLNLREYARGATNITYLKQVAFTLNQYTDKHGGRLPPMESFAAMHSALRPYVRTETPFYAAGTSIPICPNKSLSNKKMRSIPNPEQIIVFYEAIPNRGERAVVYLDGHSHFIQEVNWPQVKREAGIP